MQLDIDLTADPYGYGYPALITTRARVHELASRVLRTYLEEHYDSDVSEQRHENGVTLIDWDTNDGAPVSYTVSAQMWAGELGYILSTPDTLDPLDELESVERDDEHLAGVLERNMWDTAFAPDEELGFVSPRQVVGGVRALISDPLMAHIATRRDLIHVQVDLDVDALVHGRESVRIERVSTYSGASAPPKGKAPVPRSRWDSRHDYSRRAARAIISRSKGANHGIG